MDECLTTTTPSSISTNAHQDNLPLPTACLCSPKLQATHVPEVDAQADTHTGDRERHPYGYI